MLGSGAFAPARNPKKVRNPSGYAVRLGRRLILFDFGFGNLRQLARAGLDPVGISDVFLSHRHPDHAGDLAALLFYYRYDRKPKSKTLRVFGPRGLKSFLKRLGSAFHPWLEPRGYALKICELRPGEGVHGPGWSVASIESQHNTPSLSYRLSAGGKSMVYSGDSGYDLKLAEFARDCDLFLLECTLADRERYKWHLNASQALQLVQDSRCRKAVFTHLSEGSQAGLIRRKGPGKRVMLAEDLMRVVF